MSYHAGLTANYTGERTPDFSLPVGFGVSTSMTLNKPAGFQPTIELAAVGFPEYVFQIRAEVYALRSQTEPPRMPSSHLLR